MVDYLQLRINRPGWLVICLSILATCFISCKQGRDIGTDFSQSLRKEKASFLSISVDSVVIPVRPSEFKKVRAGKPHSFILRQNKQVAGPPGKIKFQKTKPIYPRKENFLPPQNVLSSGKIVSSGKPESFVAKEMTYTMPDPLSFAVFDKVHGLKSGIVTCLLNDREGNIWIGTSEGVLKYDGHTFSSYTTKEGFIDNDVRSIRQDKKGNIWFGTFNSGISVFDGYSFTSFTEKEGLCGNSVNGIAEDNSGNVWLTSAVGGVSKYDGKSLQNYSTKQGLINDSVNTVFKDHSGNLWFGTEGGISIFDGESFVNYVFQENPACNKVLSINEDSNGKIWIGTYGGGVLYMDHNLFYQYTVQEGLLSNDVFSLMVVEDGKIWIGMHDGLAEFDGNTFTNFGEEDGLSNENIYCIMRDVSGNVWIGTGGGGLMRYIPNSFHHITTTEGLSKNFVFGLYADRLGSLWFGLWRGGVSKYDGHSLKTYSTLEGLPYNDVRSICQDRSGNYWFATPKGVTRFDGQFFTMLTEKDGLVNDNVNDIFEDREGNLWFGTERGVSKYNGSTIVNFLYKGTEAVEVNLVRQSAGGDVFICSTKGVFRYGSSGFQKLKINEALSVNTVMEDDGGNLWIGSTNGLWKLNSEYIIPLNVNSDLIKNDVVGILKDHIGNIWFSTRMGLSKLSPAKNLLLGKRINEGKMFEDDVFFRNYSYTDNYLGIGGSRQGILETKEHQIWVGTNKGVTYFNSIEEAEDNSGPETVITNIKLADENIDWKSLLHKKDSVLRLRNGTFLKNFRFDSVSRWHFLPVNLSLDHTNNNISFEFSGITTSQSQNVRYKYILQGFDKKENLLTNQSFATYGNLAPGSYVFKVRAMDRDGSWGGEAVFPFAIRSPWWQMWWFRILFFITLFALVFGAIRFVYLYQLRRQKHILEKELVVQYERQRISTDLHDEIGSTLSSINIYSNLARTEKNKESYLDSITANVNEVVSKLDDLVWKINPKYDTLGSVINRLLFYAEPLAAAIHVNIALEMDEQLRSKNLDSESKHQLYLVLKELVNNSLKHAECKILRISISKEGNSLIVRVEDDGRGFEEPLISVHRNGLTNIKERTEKMNWNLELKTDRGLGSQIAIRIPMA